MAWEDAAGVILENAIAFVKGKSRTKRKKRTSREEWGGGGGVVDDDRGMVADIGWWWWCTVDALSPLLLLFNRPTDELGGCKRTCLLEIRSQIWVGLSK